MSQSPFIDPKTDFAFRKIFGSEDSKEVLISFLNSILFECQEVVIDLEILNPFMLPGQVGLMTSRLDVKAKLASGETVVIEMQTIDTEGFEKRVLYNAAKEYVSQLDAGKDYTENESVIALTITDFVIFHEGALENQVISCFRLLEKDSLVFYPDGDIELVFAELPKFSMAESELANMTEKWLYFLREVGNMSSPPAALSQEPLIAEALDKAKRINLTTEEADALEKRLFYMQQQRQLIRRRKSAEAERDAAVVERDTAMVERDAAMLERDALAEKLRELGVNPKDI